MEALSQKTEKAKSLYENLVKNVNEEYKQDEKKDTAKIIKPKFLIKGQ